MLLRPAFAPLLLGVLMTLSSNPALTQTPADCSMPEQRQFDFWIGHWDVFMPDGKRAGENLIEAVANGCALLESWTGAGGLTGMSLNNWDRQDRRWRQHWVDSSGGLLRLEGAWSDGHMVLLGQSPHATRPGLVVHQRITWTPMPDGSVRQLWESSEDMQTRWTTLFDGKYIKRR